MPFSNAQIFDLSFLIKKNLIKENFSQWVKKSHATLQTKYTKFKQYVLKLEGIR